MKGSNVMLELALPWRQNVAIGQLPSLTQPRTITDSAYLQWLASRGIKLFVGGGHVWRKARHILLPATVGPTYISLDETEAKRLLQESGTLLLRYQSDPTNTPTNWWHVVCDAYDPTTFSSRTRGKINRGRRECGVRRVPADWLADHGYRCYVAAQEHYKGARPELIAHEEWRRRIRLYGSGPTDLWAISVGEQLAGYCMCVTSGNFVATEIFKVDANYFKHRAMDALISTLCEHYVQERGLTLTNGNVAVLHGTNMQDFLLDRGYRRKYCRLNVVYRPWVKLAVTLTLPAFSLLEKMPESRQIAELKALLRQEAIQRAFDRPRLDHGGQHLIGEVA